MATTTESHHRILVALVLLSLASLVTQSAAAPPPATGGPGGPGFAALDAYIEAEMRAARIPGLALAVVQGDQIVHLRGFGVADPAGRAMTPQTPMLIGSVTKSFTALAVMQRVEAGRLELDAPVQRYLPWFRLADEQASAIITVRQLLQHASGLPESAGQKNLADSYAGDDALERSVRALASERLTQPVGAVSQYSNANYVVLGLLVQVVSGQPYEVYVQQHIFEPLAMRNSFTSLEAARAGGMATGHRQWLGLPVAARKLPFVRGSISSGYLVSSAEDMARYVIAQLNRGRYAGGSVLSPQGVGVMHAPAAAVLPATFPPPLGCEAAPGGYYGMGWRQLELNGVPVICHTGDTPDFHADVVLIPDGQWGIALLMNVSNKAFYERTHSLITGVTSLIVGRQPPPVPVALLPRIMYLVAVLFPLVELVLLVRQLRAWQREKTPSTIPVVARGAIFKAGLPLLSGLFGAALILFGLLWWTHVPLRVALLNQPDMGWALILLAGLIMLRTGLKTLRSALALWRARTARLVQA